MRFSSFSKQRESVARFMARLYDRGLTTAGGGNISMRLDDELFCITPSALDKSCLDAEEIIVMSYEGENLTPTLKPSIETDMHRLILRSRPDIRTIFHAHPLFASAFTALRRKDGSCPIDTHITAEAYYLLGDPVVVPYEKMGTEALAKRVESESRRANVLLLENHGIVTMAKTPLLAFEMMDVLDRAARMTVMVHEMQGKEFTYEEIPPEKRAELLSPEER